MENAVDALKMGAAVLVFVLALSVSINAFSEVTRTSRTLIEYQDREYELGEAGYVADNEETQRVVGAETIIPSIYKAYKENYKVVFVADAVLRADEGLYQKGTDKKVINYIDLEKETLGNETQKEKFIGALLYGNNYKYYNSETALTETFYEIKESFKSNSKIYLNDEGLYGKIKGKKFIEKLGVYYQEETDGALDTPEANKMTKRVITYEYKP